MGYTDRSVFSGIVAAQRGWTVPNLVGYMESHDEERIGYKTKMWGNWYIKSDTVWQALRNALSASFMLLAPGPKMIWQFGELNYDYSIDYNDRTGRKPVRWDYYNSFQRKHVYAIYSNLMAFREQFSDIFTKQNSPYFSYTIPANLSQLRKYVYTTDSVNIVLLGNFSNEIITENITYPTTSKSWYNYLDQTTFTPEATVSVAPHKFLLLIDREVPLFMPVNNSIVAVQPLKYENLKLDIYPNPVIDGKITINLPDNGIKHIEIYNLSGTFFGRYEISEKSETLDISTFPNGMYMIVSDNYSAKFVKK
jgi:hypothetical protein